MSNFVTDTHALYWHLANHPRLSARARTIFDAADQGLHQVLVPGIVLVEFVYLIERGRFAADTLDRIFSRLAGSAASFTVAALDEGTVRALARVPRAAVPDMPDRIIVATALDLGLPLISRDERIQCAGVVPIIW